MKPRDQLWLGGLLALAAFIWLRDCTWWTSADEALPLLIAPLLFVWLGEPWRGWRSEPATVDFRRLTAGAGIFVLGLALDLTLLLAAAWTIFLWAWLREKVAQEKVPGMRRLLVLALLSFPWLSLDLPSLGWWFRLSAAWTAEHSFRGLGFTTAREGTQIIIQNFPVDVTAACAGLKVLPAALVAGGMLAYVFLGRSRWYWPAIVLLPLMAWLANTLRVIMLTAVGLTLGPAAANGWFHQWGGWMVLVVMFGLCALLFASVQRWDRKGGTP